MKPIEIFSLDSDGLLHHLDALAEVLHACVHDGANVGFVLPFDLNHARAFWLQKIEPGLAADTRIVLVAKLDERVAGTVQLNLDTPPNQPHRADGTAHEKVRSIETIVLSSSTHRASRAIHNMSVGNPERGHPAYSQWLACWYPIFTPYRIFSIAPKCYIRWCFAGIASQETPMTQC